MIWPLIITGLVVGGFIFYEKSQGSGVPSDSDNSTPSPLSGNNQMGLPDADPVSQGGNYDRTQDYAFTSGRDRTGVPFALLKAHAIRESALDPNAIRVEPTGKASYGLMQILWWSGSDRFKQWGYSADTIADGTPLYDPMVNTYLAGNLIMQNWETSGHNLRDTINMYNTGVKESQRKAPNNYVDDVLNNYSTLIKGNVI